jgi:hypothetical protein
MIVTGDGGQGRDWAPAEIGRGPTVGVAGLDDGVGGGQDRYGEDESLVAGDTWEPRRPPCGNGRRSRYGCSAPCLLLAPAPSPDTWRREPWRHGRFVERNGRVRLGRAMKDSEGKYEDHERNPAPSRLFGVQPVCERRQHHPGRRLRGAGWQCPACGRAWPLAHDGQRGAMAHSACRRINASRRPAVMGETRRTGRPAASSTCRRRPAGQVTHQPQSATR